MRIQLLINSCLAAVAPKITILSHFVFTFFRQTRKISTVENIHQALSLKAGSPACIRSIAENGFLKVTILIQ